MQEYYRSRYKEITFDKEESLLKSIWFKDSKEMNEMEFKENLSHWVGGIKKFRPEKLLVDSRELGFTIDPLVQTWMAEEIYPYYVSNNVQKQAFIVSKDFFARISIVQTIDEVGKIVTETQHFESEKEAWDWLTK